MNFKEQDFDKKKYLEQPCLRKADEVRLSKLESTSQILDLFSASAYGSKPQIKDNAQVVTPI